MTRSNEIEGPQVWFLSASEYSYSRVGTEPQEKERMTMFLDLMPATWKAGRRNHLSAGLQPNHGEEIENNKFPKEILGFSHIMPFWFSPLLYPSIRTDAIQTYHPYCPHLSEWMPSRCITPTVPVHQDGCHPDPSPLLSPSIRMDTIQTRHPYCPHLSGWMSPQHLCNDLQQHPTSTWTLILFLLTSSHFQF